MIKLIKGYKFNNDYDYIKTFNTKQEQTTYFNSQQSIIINDTNYIKEHINSFKVPYDYDFLVSEGINYIIFNNGYKDIFAFVIDKEYVSEEVTRILFEVDVIQTYMFDFIIKKSFVERKVCSINEITDFDEGLNLDEHIIEGEVLHLDKQFEYYAMFNGIKEQFLTFDSNNNISNVVTIPSPTLKPTSIIDDIPYPLYFIQLCDEYPEPKYEKIELPTPGGGGTVGGDWKNGILSSSGFRFIKGFEGFAPYKYQDSGGYWTIAYGVTLHGEPTIYNDLLKKQPVSESEGAQISYRLKNENYGAKICNQISSGGITKQYQFDALMSLSYNCGIGTIIGSGYDVSLWNEIKKNPLNEAHIRPIWESFKVSSSGTQLPGLVARRKQECNMFFNKDYEVRSIAKIDGNGDIVGTVTDNNGDGWLPG